MYFKKGIFHSIPFLHWHVKNSKSMAVFLVYIFASEATERSGTFWGLSAILCASNMVIP